MYLFEAWRSHPRLYLVVVEGDRKDMDDTVQANAVNCDMDFEVHIEWSHMPFRIS